MDYSSANFERVRLSSNFPWMPLKRQTPGSRGIWGNYRFVTDDDPDAGEGEFAAWVVYNNFASNAPVAVACPRERTILVIGEPPSRGDLHPHFASQFGAVVSCHSATTDSRYRRAQQSLPWWIGLRRESKRSFAVALGYDDFDRMHSIEKTNEISIVCSNLIITPQHRQRVAFVKRLQQHFGERLAVFGAGFRSVEDKWDAIAPFKYHIALENSSVEDYWTEKLSDTFLGGAFPIYGGCPNITRYFPDRSLLQIRPEEPERSIEAIEHALATHRYEASRAAIWESRRRVLDEYNLFPCMARLIDSIPAMGSVRNHFLPSRQFAPSPGMRVRRLRYLAREAFARRWYRLVS